MATTAFKIAKGQLGFSLTDPAQPIADATIGDYTAFDCVVTAAALIASAQTSDEEIPGTFCDPAQTTTTPSGTTFELQATLLQDPQAANGLAQFLYENDSGVTGNPVYFYLGLAENAAPKAIGQCYISPMDFGGEARSVLTADVTFVVEGRPAIEFGTAADV